MAVQNSAKGDLALAIDEAGLEASLTFTPDVHGAEWTADKVLRVLMDARVGGLNQKRADDLVQKFARSKGPTKEIVASGVAPVLPVPELPEWSDLPVPPELALIVAETLAQAPDPVLFRVKVETVRVERTIKKPAALPFLPPKIEKVQTTEKREKREQVDPDPMVVRSGWAERGARIGVLSTAKPGKPGKSIFGAPIQPESYDPTFYSGPGVARNKNELLADWDGIVRVGERWVDVIPLPRHSWSVESSPDGATYFLNYTPGDSRMASPDPRQILAKALELGAPEDALVAAEEVGAALAKAIEEKEALFSWSLSLDRDAKAEVKVSPDGVVATLSIWKGRGRGRPLELSAVSAALKASLVRGFKAEELKKDVIAFYKGNKAELLDYPLAQGRAPGRGKGRSLVLSVQGLADDKAAELRKRISEQTGLSAALPSLADFPVEEATKIAYVKLGQRIGELSTGGSGQDGVDVFGKVLPGIPGNDPSVKTFENVDFGRDAITATASGVLMADERGQAWRIRVVRFRDSTIDVAISQDSMSASVTLLAEDGLGSPLSVEKVLAALAEKGVKQGLEPYSIAEAVSDARAGKSVLKKVVARGRSARAGGSIDTQWLVHKATGALYTMTEGNRADFKERDTMTRVEAGAPILKVAKTVDAGEDGVDVLGRPVKGAGSGAGNAPPEHDASIREEKQEDGSVLFVAAVGGELVIEGLFGTGGRIYIREKLSVEGDLGPETGNVKFPGNVSIAGSVLSGYSLIAGGDIAVAGAVEASLVSSDGSVRVGEGIKGARRGTIRARRGIDAAFAEQALLLAVEDVKVRNGCVLCNVKTNGRLVVAGERGSLIGGICRARKGVDVGSLGSENYAKTEISFGQDYLVADQIEAEEKEIERLKSLILQSDRTMADLERAGAGLDRIRQDKVKLVKLLEKRTHRVFDLREKFETHVASEVRVRGTVFPGVILESHNRFFEVRSKKTKVCFAFDLQLGRIVEKPL
jgi:uncharacterized protein (DUF342 family)